MAVPGSSEALAAAFVFGIVVTAASAASFFYINGRGSSLLRDGLRLVLVNFLATSTIWAIVEFVSIFVSATSNSGCQIAIVFASAFDQIARVSLQQFLLWAVKGKVDFSIATLFPQSAIFIRVVLGAIFVGVQRPQFRPVCVAETNLVALGIVVLVLDVVIIFLLLARAHFAGIFGDLRAVGYMSSRNKSFISLLVGLGIWTSMSIPMTLGMRTTNLTVRTVVPAIGLLILIVLLLIVKSYLPLRDNADSESRARGDSWLAFASQGNASTRELQGRLHIRTDTDLPSRLGDLKSETAQVTAGYRRPMTVAREGALPIISRPSPGQAEAGVGGLPVQGQLFPPMRSLTAPTVLQSATKPVTKKGVLKGGKVVISAPVLNQNAENNPLNKVATIDLATAARNDKERRGMVPQPLFSSSIATQRPPPPPPTQQLMPRSQGLRRKELTVTLTNAMPRGNSELGADRLTTAATSSAQLSPGGEEVRRRSPRIPSQGFQNPQKPPPVLSVQPTPAYITAYSSSEAPPEPPPRSPRRLLPPTTSPLQQHRVVSLPSPSPLQVSPRRRASASTSPRRAKSHDRVFTDPRAPPALPQNLPLRQSKTFSHQELVSTVPYVAPLQFSPRKASQQTGNPILTTANQLRKSAGRQYATQWIGEQGHAQPHTILFVNDIRYDDPKAVQLIMDGANMKMSEGVSVVHRPRPIPRHSSIGYSMFHSEDLSIYKQSPSSASSETNKQQAHISRESFGPFVLYPPHPLSAGDATQLHVSTGKDTKDNRVRVGEATEHDIRQRPRSMSMPELLSLTPEAEAVAQQSQLKVAESGKLGDVGNKASSPSSAGVISQGPPTGLRSASHCGTEMSYSPGEEPHSAFTRSIYSSRSCEGTRRRSSPIIPIGGLVSPPLSGELKTDGRGYGSDCSSVYSPIKSAVSHGGKLARSMTSTHNTSTTPNRYREAVAATRTIENDGKEMMPIMVDSASDQNDIESEADGTRGGRDGQFKRIRWHRRVGDECPTFSDRKGPTLSRRVLQPPPLQLYQPPKMATIFEAEASPLESPEHALDQIQQQLRNLDRPGDALPSNNEQRMTLLADMEAEMGMQENQWQQMRQELAPCPSASSGSPEHWPAVPPAVAKPGGFAPRDNLLSQGVSDKLNSPAWLVSPFMSLNGFTRDPEALQTEIAHRRRRLSTSGVGNVNFLSVANRSFSQLGSPTPPESDESDNDDDDFPLVFEMSTNNVHMNGALWTQPAFPGSRSLIASPKTLWTQNLKAYADRSEITEAPTTVNRRVTRKVTEPLRIESSQLWTRSRTIPQTPPSNPGLWSNASCASPLPQPPKQLSRPRTQKPPRRNRRISLLPDIIENPEPLFNKCGTLGIYQFPWGEKSDIARLQPRAPSFVTPMAAMNGVGFTFPIVHAQTLPSNSRTPSAFLDEFQEENGGDNFDEYDEGSDVDEDDGFDETTLWEIASLLKSDLVASRQSAFSEDSEHEEEPKEGEDGRLSSLSVNEEDGGFTYDSIPILHEPESQTPPAQPPSLWVSPNRSPVISNANGLGSEDTAWFSYVQTTADSIRAPTRRAEPASITSTALWSPQMKEEITASSDLLWGSPSAQNTAPPTPVAAQMQQSDANHKLWSPPTPIKEVSHGLPQSPVWSSYLIPKERNVKKDGPVATTPSVESDSLWAPTQPTLPQAHHPGTLWSPTASSTLRDALFSTAATDKAEVSSSLPSSWSLPTTVYEEEPQGLWSVHHQRSTFRHSDKTPPALEMRPASRAQSQSPPLQISSSSLWSRNSAEPSPNLDWISRSSARPVTPETTSSLSSNSTDTSPVSSNSSELSTLENMYVHLKLAASSSVNATPEERNAAIQQAMQAIQARKSAAYYLGRN